MALQAGNLTQVVVGPTSASLSSDAATGGNGPYTYQWYRSTQADFTPGSSTLLAGQTNLTLLDTPLLPNTVYYYRVIATDTGNPSKPYITSAPIGICTSAQGQTTYGMPAVADFKDYFDLDFPYPSDYPTDPDTDKFVRDKDILKGFRQANTAVNINLFMSQSAWMDGFMLMSAHQMVENRANSSQGVQGQYNWIQQSKGALGVSESFQLPEMFLKNPTFAGWAKTTYGSKYLRMIIPLLAGPATSAFGQTKP